MRSRPLAVVGIFLCFATVGVHAQKQFSVFASIVDVSGGPVSLEPTDVQVLENGVEAKVVKVEPMNWPIKVQLLVDNGIGLGGGNITLLKNGMLGLLDALPPGIEVTIVSTAPRPRVLARPTTDREALMKGLALLAADSGAGRFVDSLNEATQRIERDKDNYFPVIVMMATTSGDRNVLDSDVERMMKRLEQRPTTVHIVLLSGQAQSAAIGGANQTNIGLAVTEYTHGRFENINGPTRLATLLPEIGALVAHNHEIQSRQFRVTVDRPAGASGDVGTVTLNTRAGLIVNALSLDGRVP
jgi:hypothetical protein